MSDGLMGSFSRVDQADAAELVGRLDTMSALEFFRAYKRETFRLMELGPGLSVADVGCGTGEDARQLAQIVGADGHATGFDVSEAMLTEAVARHGTAQPNLEFVRSSANDLKAPDAAFDAVRADRVLTHVPDMAAAVAEMVRVLKPGGRLVVSESDNLSCWMNSTPRATTAQILQAIAYSTAQPFAARDLYFTFLDAGLGKVRLLPRTVALTDPQAAENIMKFGLAVDAMLEKGVLSAEDARQWRADYETRRQTGRFLGGATIFIVAGVKGD